MQTPIRETQSTISPRSNGLVVGDDGPTSSNFGLNFEVGYWDKTGIDGATGAAGENNGLTIAVEGLISFSYRFRPNRRTLEPRQQCRGSLLEHSWFSLISRPFDS